MNSLDVWIAIALLTIVTLAGRVSFLFAPDAWHPRGALARALTYSPLAALLAIAAPEVFRTWLEPSVWQSRTLWQLVFDARLCAVLALYLILKTIRNEFAGLIGAALTFWLLRV